MKNKSFKRQYPKHVSNRIIVFCILLIGILCTGIIYISYEMYQDDMINEYIKYERTILNIALQEADSEGIQEAIETNTKNEAYQQLSQQFNLLMKNSDITYIYALYFLENDENMYYVVNGYLEEQEENNSQGMHQLGELPREGDFSEDMIEELRKAFEQGKDDFAYMCEKDAEDVYLYTTYCPLQNANGEVVCIFCVDIAVKEIYEKLDSYLWAVIIWVTILGAAMLSIFILIMHRQLVRPIKRLADSAKDYIKQQETCEVEQLEFKKIPIRTRDELQLLSDSLTHMAEQSKEYMQHLARFAAEQERAHAEAAVVQKLKENLLPSTLFQQRNDFNIAVDITLSQKNSGDFYNFFLIDENHLCFFLGTASGGGVTTTMIAMIATIYLENYARMGYLPNRILGETNNRLSENNSGEVTVSVFLGIVDLETGAFTYAQVGELTPLIKRSGQELTELEVSSGFSLGSMEYVVFPQKTISLQQGESIFLYSQGISKKGDMKGYEFTDEYVKQSITQFMQDEFHLDKILGSFHETLQDYGKDTVQQMDETCIMFRYNG